MISGIFVIIIVEFLVTVLSSTYFKNISWGWIVPLSLYQHKQIHINPTLVVDWGLVSVAQVVALGACLHLLQLISHN